MLYTYYDIIDNLQNERIMWWDLKDIYTNYSWMWEKWVWFDFSWGKDYAVENFFSNIGIICITCIYKRTRYKDSFCRNTILVSIFMNKR